MHTLSNEELQLINLLASSTGAQAKDAVVTEDSVIFVVGKGELGRAIGKNGANIKRLRHSFKKNVEVVEEAQDLRGFLANVFKPVQLLELREASQEGKRVVSVSVNHADKGLAIGRGGERIKKARLLAKRHFDCDDVRII